MIIRDIDQGSPEWFDLRRGIPTASNFSKILTGSTLKPSTSAIAYRYDLIAQWLGVEEENYTNEWMERGNELEDEAVSWYQFDTGNETEKVAFVYGDDRKLYGCSPDALIGDSGGLEVKNPKASTHIKYLLGSAEIPAEYRPQVYGSMFVTGREWWDFVSYYPALDPFLVRVKSDDEKYLKWKDAFKPQLDKFIGQMLEEREILNRSSEVA